MNIQTIISSASKRKDLKGRLVVLLISMIVVLIGVATSVANAAFVPGGSVGPVSATTGFPDWYMDQNGLALDLIEAADSFGISDPVDPANNFSKQIGFNAEGFWWATEATVSGPTGVDASLVTALEAAFAGEAAVDGEQSAFGRVRIRISGLTAGETYTVKHPFGTQTFVAESVSPATPTVGKINSTSDIGCFATPGVSSCNPNTPAGNTNNFSLVLNSDIGPFLTWDTFNTNPALSDPALINAGMPGKRYVGNPGVEHAIKGSPVGQNFFRIEGPNVGGAGVDFLETNLFTVVGRLAVVDTAAPTIVSTTSTNVDINSSNVVLTSNITDDVSVRSATIDLAELGNTFTADFSGTQEVPATASTATGSGTFIIDTVANTLSFNITATGVTSASDPTITGIHIHGSTTTPGTIGQNAPIAFDLGTTLPAVGVWNYPESMESEILSGRTYVNIHTTLFPAGKIRGQIVHTPNVQDMTMTAGVATNGTWSVLIPGTLARTGTFNLPITASDGINVTNVTHTLTVSEPIPVPVCQTDADTDGNEIISNLEILNYVRNWKSGSVANLLLVKAIGFWKVGTGC